MMLYDVETLVATLIRDFLQDDASVAAGVPAAAVLPMRRLDEPGALVRPQLVVRADVGEEPRSYQQVTVELLVEFKEGSDAANGQTLRSTVSGWLVAIAARLREREAFGVWLRAQDVELRHGFQILRVTDPTGPVVGERDEESGIRQAVLRLVWALAVD